MPVQFPEMREDAIEALRALADVDYQRRVWVHREYPHPGFYDDLTYNINVLYDDVAVMDDPHGKVGVVLEDNDEAKAIESLGRHLDSVLGQAGPDATDAEVISRPDWSGVVKAAAVALHAMSG